MADDLDDAPPRFRSKVEVYLHLVWATQHRSASLLPEYERQVFRCIESQAKKMNCILLAVGGMPDHVHVLARTPGNVSPSALARQIKGPSSALINDLRPEFSELFRWQDGYGCFSLGPNQVDDAISYVLNQKAHHAAGKVWRAWEETNELAPRNPSRAREGAWRERSDDAI